MGVQHQMRVVAAVRGCLSQVSGRLTHQNPLAVVLQDSLEKALAAPLSTESHCAAVTLQLSTSGSDARHSSERPEFLCSHPIAARNGDCPSIAEGRLAADAGRDLLPQRGRAPSCS